MATPETERQQTRFLIPIQEYESPASRIRGFQELFTYGLRAPEPMFVVGHHAFLRYEAFGKVTPPVAEEIGKAFETICLANPGRGAYIGRAFYVPGIDNPNGPRTAAIKDKEEFIQEVTKFWNFVIENNYNVVSSDIALILHPFIHVMDPPRTHYGNLPLKEDEQLPHGAGYLVPNPQPGRPHLIKILGINGTDEAVVSFPHDIYDVDPDTKTILTKRIAFKDTTYVPGYGNEYGILEIPKRFQTLQALTDEEILTIAREVEPVLKDNSVRIEFAIQSDGVYYREIAPWRYPNPRELLKLQPEESVSGPVVRVASPEDIERIKDIDVIVYFPPEAFRIRTTDLFARTAMLPYVKRMVALVYGTIETSHMARILSDAGRSVIPVGDQDFVDGTNLRVSRAENGLPQIEILNPYEGAVIPLYNTLTLVKGEAGQKVARLALMRQANIPIPDGFAVRSQAIWQYLTDIGLASQIKALDTTNIDDYSEVEKNTRAIQKAILKNPLPSDLEKQIQHVLSQYNYPLYSVRSSSSEEDEEEQSLAGLYQSSIAIKPEDIPKMMKQTIASYFSPASIIALRRSERSLSGMTVGLAIHEYIPDTPQTVGAVIFTFRDSILIEATQGSPEGIVTGTTKDYLRIMVRKETGDTKIKTFGNPTISLPQERMNEVIDVTKQIEELFGSYQDIELLITPDRGIVVVQARPL